MANFSSSFLTLTAHFVAKLDSTDYLNHSFMFLSRRTRLVTAFGLGSALPFIMSASSSSSSAAAAVKPRDVAKKFESIEQGEGQGARVRRSIGRPELRELSPFLMLDEFNVKEPAGTPHALPNSAPAVSKYYLLNNLTIFMVGMTKCYDSFLLFFVELDDCLTNQLQLPTFRLLFRFPRSSSPRLRDCHLHARRSV